MHIPILEVSLIVMLGLETVGIQITDCKGNKVLAIVNIVYAIWQLPATWVLNMIVEEEKDGTRSDISHEV